MLFHAGGEKVSKKCSEIRHKFFIQFPFFDNESAKKKKISSQFKVRKKFSLEKRI